MPNEKPPPPTIGLVADVGGTNARFAYAAVAADGLVRLIEPKAFPAKAFPGIEAAAKAYQDQAGRRSLAFAAAACAGPVLNGAVEFTNLGWRVEAQAYARALGLPKSLLLNDLAAVAWAAPALRDDDVVEIEPSAHRRTALGAPLLVFGAGTGCNAAALIPHDGGPATVVGGEGGHAGFAPTDEVEVQIWRHLNARFGRVSVERVVSGPGILNIYEALAHLGDRPVVCRTPPEVVERARAGDALASAAVERFCRVLGAAAGDFALAFGAVGGVYIAGGVAPALLETLNQGGFRAAFEAKGRFASYCAAIPSFVVLHPYAALIGAARAATSAPA